MTETLPFLGSRAAAGHFIRLRFHMTGKISHSLMLQRVAVRSVWAFPAMKTQT